MDSAAERPPDEESVQEEERSVDEGSIEEKIRGHIQSQYNTRLDSKGAVTGDDVCEMLMNMGIPFDESEIRPLIGDWAHVTETECIESIATVRITQGADIEAVLERLETSVIHLTPLEYIRYILPCFANNPEWTYRTVRLDINIAPRHMLFASTGVVLLITGMAILVLMSLLWLNQANDREQVQMKNFHLLLSSFTQSFEQHFIKAHAETMVDQVDTMAKMIEKQQDFLVESLGTEMRHDVELMAMLLNVAGASAAERVAAEMHGALSAIAGLFGTDPSLAGLATADLVSVVQDMNNDADLSAWETVVVHQTNSTNIDVLVESRSLNCAYGPCRYDVVPCLQFRGDHSVVEHPMTTDVHRKDVLAVQVSLPAMNMTVCSTIPVAQVVSTRLQLLTETIRDWNVIIHDTYRYKRELLLASQINAKTTDRASWDTPLLRKEHPCYQAHTCQGLDELAIKAIRTGTTHKEIVLGYSNVNLHAAAAPTNFGFAVVMSLTEESFTENSRQEIVEITNYLNFNSQRTTELSIARPDPKTGVVIAQVNAFRFTDGCYGECKRFPPSAIGAVQGLATQGSGWVISPDYRPEPVLGAYSYIGNGLNMVIIIERDVQEIRDIGLQALTNIFNDNNQKYTGSLEAMLVRFAGTVPMRSFDRHGRCDHIKECINTAEFGVIYRSDCVHCVRAQIPAPTQLEFLTNLKLECPAGRNCTGAALSNEDSVVRLPLLQRNVDSRSIYGNDYRGEEVLAVYSFVQNFSVGLIVKLDRSEIEGPIGRMVGIAVGSAIAIVVLGLVLLIFFSRKVLDKIEFEWLSYKAQIDQEKVRFNDMVKDVIPKNIKDELLLGQKQAITLPSISMAFVDICNMSEKAKNWTPELVCRYLTYTFAVMEEVAQHYKLNKVRIYGDTYFCAGGLQDPRNADHSILRVASFGSVVIQLFGPKFAHYPDRVPLIRSTFEDVVAKSGPAFPDVVGNFEDVGHLVAPAVRVGVHHGVGTFCIIETGRTPTFDIFGSSVALAVRLQATSQPNRMHLSGAAKEVLERVDKEHQFEFDDPRKTVVKGQGTVTSYFINSAQVAIPSSILAKLGVEYSNLRVFYEDQTLAGSSAALGTNATESEHSSTAPRKPV